MNNKTRLSESEIMAKFRNIIMVNEGPNPVGFVRGLPKPGDVERGISTVRNMLPGARTAAKGGLPAERGAIEGEFTQGARGQVSQRAGGAADDAIEGEYTTVSNAARNAEQGALPRNAPNRALANAEADAAGAAETGAIGGAGVQARGGNTGNLARNAGIAAGAAAIGGAAALATKGKSPQSGAPSATGTTGGASTTANNTKAKAKPSAKSGGQSGGLTRDEEMEMNVLSVDIEKYLQQNPNDQAAKAALQKYNDNYNKK